jgi:uncharacterized protein YuzE
VVRTIVTRDKLYVDLDARGRVLGVECLDPGGTSVQRLLDLLIKGTCA